MSRLRNALHMREAANATPTTNHVVDILLSRSGVQMIGIYASAVVARMADFLAERYVAVMQLEGEAVRTRSPAPEVKNSVAVIPRSADPLPAPVRLPNLGPEIFFVGLCDASSDPAACEPMPLLRSDIELRAARCASALTELLKSAFLRAVMVFMSTDGVRKTNHLYATGRAINRDFWHERNIT